MPLVAVHGKNTRILANQYDLSPWFNTWEPSSEQEANESTTYGRGRRRYVPGLVDGTVSAEGLYDEQDEAAFDVLNRYMGGNEFMVVTGASNGFTFGRRVDMISGVLTTFEKPSPNDDVVTMSAEWQADGGVDFGHSLHDYRNSAAETATGDSTGLDNGESSNAGWVAHLHVITATGTTPSITVELEHSADDITYVALDDAAFDALTEPGYQRLEGLEDAFVDQYVRAAWTISGTTPEFAFGVAFSRRAN